MASVLVHEFMSLDGVIDTPSWTAEYGFAPGMAEAIGGLMRRCDGILLGRATFEMFTQTWPHRTAAEDPGAPFFNDNTKYVVSSAAALTEWKNSTLVGPYRADAIRRLKGDAERDLYTSGSGQLVRAMLADGLVDELHLFVYPLTRGAGPRLFPEDGTPRKLSLATSESYENGVLYLVYRAEV